MGGGIGSSYPKAVNEPCIPLQKGRECVNEPNERRARWPYLAYPLSTSLRCMPVRYIACSKGCRGWNLTQSGRLLPISLHNLMSCWVSEPRQRTVRTYLSKVPA